jgi:hypothetical protein
MGRLVGQADLMNIQEHRGRQLDMEFSGRVGITYRDFLNYVWSNEDFLSRSVLSGMPSMCSAFQVKCSLQRAGDG